jgi:hypothetical protein
VDLRACGVDSRACGVDSRAEEVDSRACAGAFKGRGGGFKGRGGGLWNISCRSDQPPYKRYTLWTSVKSVDIRWIIVDGIH